MKIGTHLDFQGNEIKLATFEKVNALPNSNLFIGRTCILISEKEVNGSTINVGLIYYYNGEQWCHIEEVEPLKIDETKINVIDDEITLHTFDTLSDAKTYINSNNKPKSIIIGSNAGVTSIGINAFQNCTSLTSITIPSSVTSIGDYTFQNCTSLKSITIPSSVTRIGNNAFTNCTSLTSITIPSSVTSIGNNAFSGCTSLTSITIPSSVTSINGSAFYNCTSLKSINIPNGVTSIGNYAFSDCTSLTSITIPSSVTNIGTYTFQNCTSLTSITVSNGVTNIGTYTFQNCTSLTSITIPSSVTRIGDGAFRNCTSLKSITIPSSVTSIGDYTFQNCTSLKSITIPSSVTSIGINAFSGCTALTSITIPYTITSIGTAAFFNCDILALAPYKNKTGYPWGATDIKLSNEKVVNKIRSSNTDRQVPTAKAVYDEMSLDISCLKSYIERDISVCALPNTITKIRRDCFSDSSIEYIEIPDSVTSIGANTFDGCTSLDEIIINKPANSISGSPWGAPNATVTWTG